MSTSITSGMTDRKSTRLNSSHTVISYAVFCLKTEKEKREADDPSTQQQIRRIGLFLGSGAELAGEREAFSIFADPHLIGIKSVNDPELLVDVVEFLGQFERAVPGGSDGIDSAGCPKHGIGERCLQQHFPSRIRCRHAVQCCERPPDRAPASFP